MQTKTNILIGIVVAAAGLGGCTAEPSLDEQIRRLAKDGIGRAGDQAAPLASSTARSANDRRADTLRTNPPTRNPAASDLTFSPADEARDVSARLEAHAQASGVPINGVVSPPAQGTTRVFTLADVLRQGQSTGREFLSAQEEYTLAAIDLLVTRHLWGPRLFNDTTVSLNGRGDDGRFEHTANLLNRLRAAQRLPYGGSVEAAWVWNATDQLRDQASGRYTQSSSLVLSGTIPLLRGAGQVAREDLIQGERDLVYAARRFERFRREYLVQLAADFFELLNAKASIANQERQLESLRTNAQRTQALVTSGRLEGFERDIARSEVLSAEAGLAGQRDQYILQIARFRVRLGLGVDDAIDVADEAINLPEPDTDMGTASATALDLRLDLQNQRDQLDDRRRGVVNARDGLLPELNLQGSVTIPTDNDARVGHVDLSPDDLDYALSATLSLPLDRREEQLRLRSSILALQKAQRDYDQARDNVVVRVRSALRTVELARFQLTLAEQQVKINERRKVSQELQRDTIDAQKVIDTENALAASRNQRDRALTSLRNAVLNYLLESDQLRVAPDGTLMPLPGMVPAPAPAPAPAP